MNNRLLRLAVVILVPDSELLPDTPDAEIIDLCKTLLPEDHIPGTTALTSEGKPTTSGQVFTSELSYSFAGTISEERNARILKAGAVVAHATNGDVLVIHKNDLFNNTKLRPEVNSAGLRTQVKFSISTLKPLF